MILYQWPSLNSLVCHLEWPLLAHNLRSTWGRRLGSVYNRGNKSLWKTSHFTLKWVSPVRTASATPSTSLYVNLKKISISSHDHLLQCDVKWKYQSENWNPFYQLTYERWAALRDQVGCLTLLRRFDADEQSTSYTTSTSSSFKVRIILCSLIFKPFE